MKNDTKLKVLDFWTFSVFLGHSGVISPKKSKNLYKDLSRTMTSSLSSLIQFVSVVFLFFTFSNSYIFIDTYCHQNFTSCWHLMIHIILKSNYAQTFTSRKINKNLFIAGRKGDLIVHLLAWLRIIWIVGFLK